jgi:basic membrane protein A
MDPDRRRLLKLAGAAGLTGLAGCTGGPDDGGDRQQGADGDGGGDGDGSDGGAGGSDQTTTAADVTDVGMVYAAGGLGDGSFNDQAQDGLLEAESQLDVEYRETQPENPSEFETFQRQFAGETDPDYDLVCCIGFLQTGALEETAPAFPDQSFMLVDSVVDEDNVASYTFKEHEGSFLVGELAGMLTTREFSAGVGATAGDSATVGFIGGVESDLIRRFQAGYEAGVAAAAEDVAVLTNYVGDFSDPAGGREAALAMYNDGADVVYHAAGNSGTGVFQAAQQRNRFAVGVDSDQSLTRESYADVILASMVKRVDTAVFDAIQAVDEDSFEGGTVASLGLYRDGVGITYGQQLGDEIPEDVRDTIAQSRRQIIDGEIDVPTDPDDVE